MSESNNQLAVQPKASDQLASLIGMEKPTMLSAIKAQCFKGNPENVTDAQLAAFVSIAAAMQVNPLLPGMIYAYPIQGGGIVPMMGPDGVFKKLAEHPEVDSWEVEVLPVDPTMPPTHAVARIWRKSREKPLSKTCSLAEWKVGSNPNWTTRPRHMLELRTLKQCARQIIHGIPFDEDERVMMGEINVTPEPEAKPIERPAPPPRQKKGAAAIEKPAGAIDVQATPANMPTRQPSQEELDEAARKMKADQKAAEDAKLAEDMKAREAKLKETKPVAEPEPAKTEPPKAEAPVQRALLKDGEEITVVCTVVEATGMFAGLTDEKGNKRAAPTALLKLDGGYYGSAHHFDGAAGGDHTKDPIVAPTPLPIWKVGGKVKVTLLGKMSEKQKRVMVRVIKAESAEAALPEEF